MVIFDTRYSPNDYSDAIDGIDSDGSDMFAEDDFFLKLSIFVILSHTYMILVSIFRE